jgi:hypothetical protein
MNPDSEGAGVSEISAAGVAQNGSSPTRKWWLLRSQNKLSWAPAPIIKCFYEIVHDFVEGAGASRKTKNVWRCSDYRK